MTNEVGRDRALLAAGMLLEYVFRGSQIPAPLAFIVSVALAERLGSTFAPGYLRNSLRERWGIDVDEPWPFLALVDVESWREDDPENVDGDQ